MPNRGLRAPFPWFGGKSRVAHLVWPRLGDVPNYVEPFFGSGAVLLGRPHEPKIETVNDLDGYVANFWRALKADPVAVAEHATNECDLHARNLWLATRRAELEPRLCADPEFYDARAAGWWAWVLACWIGRGAASLDGPWVAENGLFVKRSAGQGVTKRRPQMKARGVTKLRPHLGKMQGVTKQLPHTEPFAPSEGLLTWFHELAVRLRNVRVCCGDWTRVMGPTPTIKQGLTGVFLDPPYGHNERDSAIYAVEQDVTRAVEAWCREHGQHPLLRIALCGYEGEYDLPGWDVTPWKAHGGYGLRSDKRGRANAGRERIWFSPNCLPENHLF